MDVAKLQSCQEWEKCVIIILDEMHIREDLVFDKHSGALIGFTNLGEVNSHLLAYEHSISQSEKSPDPAVYSANNDNLHGPRSVLQLTPWQST